MLVNLTNDAWYGRISAPYQHFAMARLRAVENARYLVRAANTGISAVVDPRGRVVARSDLFERTVIVEDVAPLTGQTFYSRYGDVFPGRVLRLPYWARPPPSSVLCGARRPLGVALPPLEESGQISRGCRSAGR